MRPHTPAPAAVTLDPVPPTIDATRVSLGFLAVIVLVLANAFFVATEFAIVAVRRSRLEQLAAKGQADARAAQALVGNLDTYVAACQLGITLASLALGWIGEPAFASLVEPTVARLAGPAAHEVTQGASVAVAFALITALHIVLGELAPKGVALQRTESTVLFVARPMLVFHAIFRWPIAVLNAAGNGVLRLVGLRGTSSHEAVHSVDELRLLVARMQEAGVVDMSEARIASRAVEFGDVPAAALMTPRTEIEAVPLSSTLAELVHTANTSEHNRWPVYDSSLDQVIGVLHLRSVLRALAQSSVAFDLRTNLRPILVAPASKPARDLLDDMRASGQHVAVLLDEYGGTAGMLTLHDMLGALVGRIDAETSTTNNLSLEHAPEGSLVLDGLTRLSEVEDVTGVRLEDDAHDVETLGGLVMYRLGAMPSVGDEIQLDDWLIRVLELDGRRVARLQLQREAPEP